MLPEILRFGIQSSQMVSRSISPRRSAPQTLHLLRLSRDPKLRVRPRGGTSPLVRDFASAESEQSTAFSAASASALRRAILSASRAASSASGESGIVSKLEILGLLDRAEDGVDDIDDDANDEREPYPPGYESADLYEGEDGIGMALLVVKCLKGEAGRR